MPTGEHMAGYLARTLVDERFPRTQYWGEVPYSGLGDRLTYLYLVSLVGLVMRTNYVCSWAPPGCASRTYDLAIVKARLSLPKCLELVEYGSYVGEWPDMSEPASRIRDGFRTAVSDRAFFAAHKGQFRFHDHSTPIVISNHSSLVAWVRSIFEGVPGVEQQLSGILDKSRRAARFFEFVGTPPGLPNKYICVHARGGDKRKGRGGWDSRYETSRILSRIYASCSLPTIVVSDDTHQWIKAQGIDCSRSLVVPHNANYTTACIDDMSVLSRAQGIVQHSPHGWSSFSNFANIMYHIPLISTCRTDYNIYYPTIHTHVDGRRWTNHYNHDEVVQFLACAMAPPVPR